MVSNTGVQQCMGTDTATEKRLPTSSNSFPGYEVCLTFSEIQLTLLLPQESLSVQKASRQKSRAWRCGGRFYVNGLQPGIKAIWLHVTFTLPQNYRHTAVSSLVECFSSPAAAQGRFMSKEQKAEGKVQTLARLTWT